MSNTSRGYVLGQLTALLIYLEVIIDSDERHLRGDFHPFEMRHQVRDYLREGSYHKIGFRSEPSPVSALVVNPNIKLTETVQLFWWMLRITEKFGHRQPNVWPCALN